MSIEERAIKVGDKEVTILEYRSDEEDEAVEYLNMTNASAYVGCCGVSTAQQRILHENREGRLERRRIPGRGGYYVKRSDLDRIRDVMSQPEVVPPLPPKRRAG